MLKKCLTEPTLLETQEVYKKSVRGVEIGDAANPQSGTKFSLEAIS